MGFPRCCALRRWSRGGKLNRSESSSSERPNAVTGRRFGVVGRYLSKLLLRRGFHLTAWFGWCTVQHVLVE